MLELTEISHGIWTFKLPMPSNPLKWLNCYVIKGGKSQRDLLVDTGVCIPECQTALFYAMKELEIEPDNTDIFLTHFHPDHTENAALLQKMGCRILMSENDRKLHMNIADADESFGKRILKEGIPKKLFDSLVKIEKGRFSGRDSFVSEDVNDGDILRYGAYELRCISTPGHTPGGVCFHIPEEQVLFSGDSLFRHAVGRCDLPGGDERSLLQSLKQRILTLPEEVMVLPGHGDTTTIGEERRSNPYLAS